MRALKIPGLSWKGRTVLLCSAVSAAAAAGLTVAAWHFLVLAVAGTEHPALLAGVIDRLGGAVAGVLCAFLVGGLVNYLGEALLRRWRGRRVEHTDTVPLDGVRPVGRVGAPLPEQHSRWYAGENVLRN